MIVIRAQRCCLQSDRTRAHKRTKTEHSVAIAQQQVAYAQDTQLTKKHESVPNRNPSDALSSSRAEPSKMCNSSAQERSAPGDGRIESPAPVGVPLLPFPLHGDGGQHVDVRTVDGENASLAANILPS